MGEGYGSTLDSACDDAACDAWPQFEKEQVKSDRPTKQRNRQNIYLGSLNSNESLSNHRKSVLVSTPTQHTARQRDGVTLIKPPTQSDERQMHTNYGRTIYSANATCAAACEDWWKHNSIVRLVHAITTARLTSTRLESQDSHRADAVVCAM